jgi:hypothetical protein
MIAFNISFGFYKIEFKKHLSSNLEKKRIATTNIQPST